MANGAQHPDSPRQANKLRAIYVIGQVSGHILGALEHLDRLDGDQTVIDGDQTVIGLRGLRAELAQSFEKTKEIARSLGVEVE